MRILSIVLRLFFVKALRYCGIGVGRISSFLNFIGAVEIYQIKSSVRLVVGCVNIGHIHPINYLFKKILNNLRKDFKKENPLL